MLRAFQRGNAACRPSQRGSTNMAGAIARDMRDPIAVAEADIAGSKHLIASVADDLSEHQRWLAHYRVAEKRRARRLKLQTLIYRTELGFAWLIQTCQRLALAFLHLAQSGAAFLWRRGAALG